MAISFLQIAPVKWCNYHDLQIEKVLIMSNPRTIRVHGGQFTQKASGPRYHNLYKLRALKCKPSAEFGADIGIFGLKTPLHVYVLGEHTSIVVVDQC